MSDVRTLLSHAAGPPPVVTPDVVDADLARARHALRRRTVTRAVTSVAASAVAVAVVAVTFAQAPTEPPPMSDPPMIKGTTPAFGAVRLVAYTGEQPSGYRVAYVPTDWEIQGANEFRLTIAPIGFADRNPDSFVDKIVVMLRSRDDTGRPVGRTIPVGDGTGYVNEIDSTTTVLTFRDSAGHWVQVQVPAVLRWSDRELGRFGAGVEITRDAEPGRG